ncbi:hypothetical protein C8J57DRAFT_1729536 [Mycena rebaudengoi]|nr:hypothetical protein C8J57DRAFT_1729536 [Mycena rebaudengoi]
MHPRAASAQVALAAASTTIFAYHVLQSFYSTKRQRAWIITGLSSCAMTAANVPFVLDIIMSRGDVTALLPRPHLSPLISQTFQGFLIADLLVGSRHYPDQFTFCWGWIHHTMYILLMQYTIRRGWTHVFCLCAVMELPISHLAIDFATTGYFAHSSLPHGSSPISSSSWPSVPAAFPPSTEETGFPPFFWPWRFRDTWCGSYKACAAPSAEVGRGLVPQLH